MLFLDIAFTQEIWLLGHHTLAQLRETFNVHILKKEIKKIY